MAYDSIAPFGDERADLRTALICQTLANIARGKAGKPFSLQDFLLRFDGPAKPEQTGEEIRLTLKAWYGLRKKG